MLYDNFKNLYFHLILVLKDLLEQVAPVSILHHDAAWEVGYQSDLDGGS